jgi:hypothetical protein
MLDFGTKEKKVIGVCNCFFLPRGGGKYNSYTLSCPKLILDLL